MGQESRLEDPFPRCFTWLWASVPHHMSLSIWLLQHSQDMTASFPKSKWSRREQGRSHSMFYDLLSEATHLVVTQVGLIHCGRGPQRLRIPRGEITGAILEGWLPLWEVTWCMEESMVYGLQSEFKCLFDHLTNFPKIKSIKLVNVKWT